MTDITNKKWNAKSDTTLVKTIGNFIKHHRLQQNKTQLILAEEAGINRSTLSQFERGMRANLGTFVQLLRALKLLYVLQQFTVQPQLSPLQLATIEQAKRKRAGKAQKATKKISEKRKSNW